MSHRPFKDRLYAEFATIGKTLANTSAHLQVLRQARLVEADKRGLNVVYRLAASDVFTLWRTLRDLGTARLAEIDRLVETFLTDRSSLAAVDMAELRMLVEEGRVLLLD